MAEKKNMPAIRYRLFSIGPKGGFTIMEVLVVLGSIVVLSATLSAVVVYTNRSAAVERMRADLVAENRLLIDETTRAIKMASTVLALATVLGTSYTSGGETLVIEVPAIDNDQDLITNVSDRMVYRKIGSNYELIQDAGPGSVRPDTVSRIFSDRVAALTFTYYDSNGNVLNTNLQNALSVRISCTLTDSVRNQTITSTLSETATLRNK